MKMLKPILATLVISVLALPALAQRGGPAPVFAEPVRQEPFAMRIEALGTLEPKERAELTLNAADRVTAVYFDDGQRVKAGKSLLSLAQREQAALVEAAEANAEEAQRQLERITRLAAADAVSKSELDQATSTAERAQANLRAVQSRQRDRVLVAPFDGVLGFRRVSVGSFVRPGDVVAILIDDSEMRLEFAVPSIFLTALKPGTPIEARTDDLPGRVFSGELTSLDNAIDPITRSVRVRATLPNGERLLKAGMFMTVDLDANARMGLSIPEEAIEPRGPKFFAYTVAEGDDGPVAKRIEVEIGMRERGRVEVVSGLEAGDLVVTEGLIRIRDGAPVKVMDRSVLNTRSNGGAGPAAASASSPG